DPLPMFLALWCVVAFLCHVRVSCAPCAAKRYARYEVETRPRSREARSMTDNDQPLNERAIEERYLSIRERIWQAAQARGPDPASVKLVAGTKTFAAESILPVLYHGHRCFGENRVQEATHKWPGLRERFPDIELHLIGPLQSNKARDAVALFDYIETLD